MRASPKQCFPCRHSSRETTLVRASHVHSDIENCLGETRRRTSMERTVVWRRAPRFGGHASPGEKGGERERKPCRSESVPAPVEVRLQELGDRCGFDRCPGSSRRRHAGRGAYRNVRITAEGQ